MANSKMLRKFAIRHAQADFRLANHRLCPLGHLRPSPQNAVALDRPLWSSHITFMALSRKKATTIALDPEDDRLLSRAARERGVSRSEFVRQHLALVLEQYRRHPKPRSAGIVRGLTERGDERELFAGGR